MSEKMKGGEVPPQKQEAAEYGSERYWNELQEQHDEEEAAFVKAGWHALNCSRPFYMYPATSPEGTKKTVADTAIQSPGSGFDWWWIEGEVTPPEGMSRDCSVFEVKNGKWVEIEKE